MPTDGGDEFWIVGPFAFIRKVPEPDYMKSKKNRIAVAVLKEHGFQAGANSSTVVTGAKGDKCVYVKFQHDFLCFGTKVLVSPYGARYPGYDQEAKTIADEIRARLKKGKE